MHRITKFDIKQCCNEYVVDEAVETVKKLVEKYKQNPTSENYLRVLYNVPTGFELTAGLTTNYRQLKTIYYQRRTHKLHEWRKFCEWVETLPHFKEIILKNKGE